jgi:hypothetical protein
MTATIQVGLVEANLLALLAEVETQPEVGSTFPPEMQSFSEQVDQVREYIVDAGEYSVAYECLVSLLASFPFTLSGPAAVKLLELGLLMGFKTERPEDLAFDRR